MNSSFSDTLHFCPIKTLCKAKRNIFLKNYNYHHYNYFLHDLSETKLTYILFKLNTGKIKALVNQPIMKIRDIKQALYAENIFKLKNFQVQFKYIAAYGGISRQ